MTNAVDTQKEKRCDGLSDSTVIISGAKLCTEKELERISHKGSGLITYSVCPAKKLAEIE